MLETCKYPVYTVRQQQEREILANIGSKINRNLRENSVETVKTITNLPKIVHVFNNAFVQRSFCDRISVNSVKIWQDNKDNQ